MFELIDHVGIAVPDLEEAVAQYESRFAMKAVHRETMESQGVAIAMMEVGVTHVELMEATGEDTPVGRFIAKRGPGIHHVAYRVDDIAKALEHVKAAGVRAIDEVPRPGAAGTTVAFLHPATLGGVLTELVQAAPGGH
jgi:methylmalonyl-CoA epimerase